MSSLLFFANITANTMRDVEQMYESSNVYDSATTPW